MVRSFVAIMTCAELRLQLNSIKPGDNREQFVNKAFRFRRSSHARFRRRRQREQRGEQG